MRNLEDFINSSYKNIIDLAVTSELKDAIETIISTLDCGGIRVAENISNNWICNEWIKKAILIAFKIKKNQLIDNDFTKFYDKLDLKFTQYSQEMLDKEKIRVVPGAIVRKGAYIGKNTVLMPSFTNIGAYIDDNCMIDTWATIGSCAQIGKNVHISGGVGIGGVLEPLQNNPTIIEDDCFIGARSEIVEGVIIGKGSVISMGVYIGQSTKIYNSITNEVTYGIIPPYSVVIPGSLPNTKQNFSTYAAIIIKKVDENTRKKVSINELLRL